MWFSRRKKPPKTFWLPFMSVTLSVHSYIFHCYTQIDRQRQIAVDFPHITFESSESTAFSVSHFHLCFSSDMKRRTNHTWLWQILAITGSALSMTVIGILLTCFNNRPIFDWNGVTLNVIIAIFSVMSKSMLAYTLSECLGQAKWLGFHRSNDLSATSIWLTAEVEDPSEASKYWHSPLLVHSSVWAPLLLFYQSSPIFSFNWPSAKKILWNLRTIQMFKSPTQNDIVRSCLSCRTIGREHRKRIWECNPPFRTAYFSQTHGFLNKLNDLVPPQIAHGIPSHLWPFAVTAMILQIKSQRWMWPGTFTGIWTRQFPRLYPCTGIFPMV